MKHWHGIWAISPKINAGETTDMKEKHGSKKLI
jgi:hypothetical protein